MNTSDVILLGYFGGADDVADFRVIWPAAHLNQVVMASFALLFTPVAARMFARNDREGINNLYWQTAIWIAVLTFPIFALTFSLAAPVTETLYGSRYAGLRHLPDPALPRLLLQRRPRLQRADAQGLREAPLRRLDQHRRRARQPRPQPHPHSALRAFGGGDRDVRHAHLAQLPQAGRPPARDGRPSLPASRPCRLREHRFGRRLPARAAAHRLTAGARRLRRRGNRLARRRRVQPEVASGRRRRSPS